MMRKLPTMINIHKSKLIYAERNKARFIKISSIVIFLKKKLQD